MIRSSANVAARDAMRAAALQAAPAESSPAQGSIRVPEWTITVLYRAIDGHIAYTPESLQACVSAAHTSCSAPLTSPCVCSCSLGFFLFTSLLSHIFCISPSPFTCGSVLFLQVMRTIEGLIRGDQQYSVFCHKTQDSCDHASLSFADKVGGSCVVLSPSTTIFPVAAACCRYA